ncbi:MAG: PAS domain S-box protein [Ignavibacteriales bacterium]
MNKAKNLQDPTEYVANDHQPVGNLPKSGLYEVTPNWTDFQKDDGIQTNYAQVELFCRFRPDFSVIHANEACSQYYGLVTENLDKYSLWSLVPEEKHPELTRVLSLFTPDNPTRTYEYKYMDAGGEFCWHQWTIWALYDQNGAILEYLAVVRDITDRKKTEEKLGHRMAIEEAVANISKLLLEPQDVEMDFVLETLGKVFSASTVHLFQVDNPDADSCKYNQWGRGSRNPAVLESLNPGDILPDWQHRMKNGEPVLIMDIDSLGQNIEDRRILKVRGIRSLLAVPIRDAEFELAGFLGLEDVSTNRRWLDEDVRYLTVVAGMLSSYWIRIRTRYELEAKVLERTARLVKLNTELRNEISERQAAEKEREISETRYRAIVENQSEFVFRTLPDLTITFVNARYCKIFGESPEDYIGQHLLAGILPEDTDHALSYIQSTTPEDPEFTAVLRATDAQDNIIWVEVTGTAIFKDGSMVEYQGVGRDITERKHQEEALARSEANFRVLAETSPALICVIQRGKLRYVNPAGLNILGYDRDELIGKDSMQIIHTEFWEISLDGAAARLNKESFSPFKIKLIGKDAREIWGFASVDIIDYEGRPAIVGVVVDMTELHKMEDEFIKASKLESIGMLAGGIAHDFNNILTVISGNVSLAKMLLDANNDIVEMLNEVEEASLQARELTQQLLTFSRGGAPIREAASIHELILDSASFVLRGSNVRCLFSIPDDLPAVNIDKGQISQVINNLIINADQAMPEGGVINVKAEKLKMKRNSSLPLKAGDYVEITIIDQGIGIPGKYLDKIFDPYFTTKQKGHGLGLATCYSIMKKHEGDIQVESQPGIGTTIRLYLPALPQKAEKRLKVEELPTMGSGQVLIMDDEEAVRSTLGRMIEKLGYKVQYAGDGQAALDTYLVAIEANDPFDLVIMDLTIPGAMGGKEAVSLLLEMDPQAKAVVSSGYSNDPVMSDYAKYGFKGVIPKPYKINELGTVLDRVIKE